MHLDFRVSMELVGIDVFMGFVRTGCEPLLVGSTISAPLVLATSHASVAQLECAVVAATGAVHINSMSPTAGRGIHLTASSGGCFLGLRVYVQLPLCRKLLLVSGAHITSFKNLLLRSVTQWCCRGHDRDCHSKAGTARTVLGVFTDAAAGSASRSAGSSCKFRTC